MSDHPNSRRFVDWTLRHGRLLWTIALLIAAPALWRMVLMYVHLKSDLEELLPRASASVHAIDELRQRMPGVQYLGVVVDVGTSEQIPQGEHLLNDLAERVRAYPPTLVRSVRLGNQDEKKFLDQHAPLYVSLDDLRVIHQRITARRDFEVTQGLGLALDDEENAPPLDFADIQKKYDGKMEGKDRFPTGRFSNPDQRTTMMLIQVGGFDTGRSQGKALLERVQHDIAALGGPAHYAPGMRLGYSGDVAISVEETSALLSDLSIASVIVLFAVIGVIVVYFRWFRSILVLFPPLLLATIYSFALASLPPFSVTELNSNTAFLGSIIVGNGINFGIILLARYVEERRSGSDVHSSLVEAVAGSRAGTLVASLAASVSYGALVITQFRGFRQFGYIGGIGMVMSWLTAFVLLPPLLAWIDHSEKTAPPLIHHRFRFTNGVSYIVQRHFVGLAILAVVLTGLGIAKIRTFSSQQLETDFSKLRRADTWVNGEGYWGGKMDQLLGEYLTPLVLLTDSSQAAHQLETVVRDAATRPPLSDRIATIRTFDDVYPPQQTEKIDVLREIRRDVTPRMQAQLSPAQKQDFDRLLGSDRLQPFAVADLPASFTTVFQERDNSLGRTVLVYPKISKALWEGDPIADFVSSLRALARQANPTAPARVAGSLPLSADILSSIKHDGPLASLAAFLGVALVVIVIFRLRRTTAYVIGALVVGVIWLSGAMLALGIKVNFANFIAFPITFGIGVDYAVNVVSRYLQEGSKDILHAVRTSGSAVTLCSLTTILGYSSLLLAENRALYLFGWVAVLGEIACLTAAIVALPACLLLVQQRRASR